MPLIHKQDLSEAMSDQSENVVLRLLRDIRREMTDQRTLLLALVEQGQRLERRISETRDDIELMLRAELMGRLGNFETRFEQRLDDLERRP
jgi:hypothetical protein